MDADTAQSIAARLSWLRVQFGRKVITKYCDRRGWVVRYEVCGVRHRINSVVEFRSYAEFQAWYDRTVWVIGAA